LSSRFSRLVSFGIAGALALALAFGSGQARVDAQAPPAPPVPNGTPNPPSNTPPPANNVTPLPSNAPVPTVTATPSPTPEPEGRHHRRRPAPEPEASADPSATPTSPAFSTLDGTWETQVQYIDRTDYSYLVIKQNDTGELFGEWRVGGKKYPLSGSYDGRLIRLEVQEPTGALTFSGYVEGATDMIGTIDFLHGKGDPTPFTAEHRAAPKNPFKRDATPVPASIPTPLPKKP
jgi:hypothetical protein